MSELINNSKIRQEQLKALIKKIHNGMSLDEAKAVFKRDFGEITTEEIVALEQSLVEEGMAVSDIQSLCDVHAAVFDGSISDIHTPKNITDIPGHPAKVFRDENTKVIHLIDKEIAPYLGRNDGTSLLMLRLGIERLMEISKHYARKEYLFFPGLEKKNITSIPKVMWGVDDEIRTMLKDIKKQLDNKDTVLVSINPAIEAALTKVRDMVTKENNILLPKLAETLSYYDWIKADQGSAEIGYFLEAPTESWAKVDTPQVLKEKTEDENKTSGKKDVVFDAGTLLPEEINAILNTLPLDMTFVDKDGHVKYFTQGKERIFSRPKSIIGRHVSMCHPPKSVHIVEAIVESFKSGKKDHEDFYIHMGPKFVYIRYFAIRNKNGDYLGTLEITQDIQPIQALEGEKRLVEGLEGERL